MRVTSALIVLAATAAVVLAGCTAGPDHPVPSALEAPRASATAPGPEATRTAATAAPVPPAPQPEPTTPAEPAPPPAPVYTSTISEITPDLAARMASSWREGCPVPLADLRYVTVAHHDFDGGVATGELVVHADVADGIVAVFRTLFDAGYPIRLMRLVDDFGGSDDASMAADNTSAFNCRAITRGTGWSEHAYGRALDLNPRENPYVRGSLVLPVEGTEFASRPQVAGVIQGDDVVVQAFAAAGWQWGGYWSSPRDYQHFSVSGR